MTFLTDNRLIYRNCGNANTAPIACQERNPVKKRNLKGGIFRDRDEAPSPFPGEGASSRLNADRSSYGVGMTAAAISGSSPARVKETVRRAGISGQSIRQVPHPDRRGT